MYEEHLITDGFFFLQVPDTELSILFVQVDLPTIHFTDMETASQRYIFFSFQQLI